MKVRGSAGSCPRSQLVLLSRVWPFGLFCTVTRPFTCFEFCSSAHGQLVSCGVLNSLHLSDANIFYFAAFFLLALSSEAPLSHQKLSVHRVFQNSGIWSNTWILALANSQWLGPWASDTGGLGSIPVWGNKIYQAVRPKIKSRIKTKVQVFSWKWQSHFVHFLEAVCQIPVSLEPACQSFFHIKMVFPEKNAFSGGDYYWYTE